MQEASLQRSGPETAAATCFRVSVPDLSLSPGSVTAILGPSAAGKTTLLLGLLGLGGIARVGGRVSFRGAAWPLAGSPAQRELLAQGVCLLLQDAQAALDPVARIGEQVAALTGAESVAIVAALASLGVEDAEQILLRYPHQVSGGEARRVTLAIALLRRPGLVVADEPSAGLDEARKRDLVRCLLQLKEKTGCALLISTHDHDFAVSLGADPYALSEGVLVPGWPENTPWPVRQHPVAPDASVVLSARQVQVRHAERLLLDGVDCEVRRGEIVAICGPSGAGKTTLARAFVGHLDRRAGFVVKGSIMRPSRIAATQLLYQNAFASLTPGLRLRSMLKEAYAADFDFEAEAAALGLDSDCLDRRAVEMSGGQVRRAALLRALAVRPEVLILDEPTAMLDRRSSLAVVETLLRAQDRCKLAILWITHDLGLAEAIADSVRHMEGGRLCS